jgi:hypothetical protein
MRIRMHHAGNGREVITRIGGSSLGYCAKINYVIDSVANRRGVDSHIDVIATLGKRRDTGGRLLRP